MTHRVDPTLPTQPRAHPEVLVSRGPIAKPPPLPPEAVRWSEAQIKAYFIPPEGGGLPLEVLLAVSSKELLHSEFLHYMFSSTLVSTYYPL